MTGLCDVPQNRSEKNLPLTAHPRESPPAAHEWRVYDHGRRTKWRIPVLHEDEALIALNKPGRLPVIPERWHPDWPCLKSIAAGQLGARVWVVHRLDAGTSGVVVLAKTAEAHRDLCEQFTHRRVEKIYLAIASGRIEAEEQTVQLPLAPHPKKPGVTIVQAGGKPAATTLRVIERFHGFTLVEARPQTGRQHQIRVHLQAIGHPLLVDHLYAKTGAFFLSAIKPGYRAKAGEQEQPLIQRLTLHASALRFVHPLRAEFFTLHAPFPKDFGAVLAGLRKYAR